MADFPSSLERIASRQSSFILFGDRVYALHPERVSQDTLKMQDSLLYVVPSVTFGELEKQEDIIYSGQIEQYCRDFVKGAIDTELKAVDDIKKEKDRITILKFIMNEFLPYLVSRRYGNEDILLSQWEAGTKNQFDPVEQAKADITAKLLADFGEQTTEEKADPAEALWKTVLKKEQVQKFITPTLAKLFPLTQFGLENDVNDSALGEVSAHQALYVLHNEVYALIPSDTTNKDLQVSKDMEFSIQGHTYYPSAQSVAQLSDLAHAVTERNKSKWRINALNRDQNIFAEIRSKIKASDIRERHIVELSKLKEYDLGDCGFILHNNSEYYVFSRVPKFATQDGRNGEVFWPYDATRVAIKINVQDTRIHSPDDPVVVEKREYHPCLRNRTQDGGFYHLCNLNRRSTSYTDKILDMVRKLSDAANVIRGPLNKESLDSHEGHTYFGDRLVDILRQGSLTREEAMSKGYAVVEVLTKKQKAKV